MTTPVTILAGLWLMAWAPSGAAAYVPPPASVPAHATKAAADTSKSSRDSLLDLSDEELRRRVETDLSSLGSLSIGSPGSSKLVNAVNLPAGPRWIIAPAADTWGTTETMASLRTAIDKVHELFPETQPVFIGDISNADGGRMKRHESHQGGRDVDVGFYYKNGSVKWFESGTAANLDLARNWAFVRALVTCTDIEAIFLDTRIQKQLYNYALSVNEDKTWLDRVFQFSRGYRSAIVQHIPRHGTHYHVRFFNPVAQELGRRAFPFLVEFNVVKPPTYTVRHVVQQGQTLGSIASRYGTSVRAIMQANALATTQVRAGRSYRIPVRATAPPVAAVVVPLRTLPPATPTAMAAAEWPTLMSMYAERLAPLLDFQWMLTVALPRF
jgi:penicillin-insensitive murein endopeptidase